MIDHDDTGRHRLLRVPLASLEPPHRVAWRWIAEVVGAVSVVGVLITVGILYAGVAKSDDLDEHKIKEQSAIATLRARQESQAKEADDDRHRVEHQIEQLAERVDRVLEAVTKRGSR